MYIGRVGSRDLAIVLENVPPKIHAEEGDTEKIRSASEIWLGYLRLAAPRREPRISGHIQLEMDGALEPYQVPRHREFWSAEDARQGVTSLVNARVRYRLEDQTRIDAAMCWAGLALSIWRESPIRATGLVWMALEALFKAPLDGSAIWPYLKRLGPELSYEIARYHQGLRAVEYKKRGSSECKSLWVWKVPDIKQSSSNREWLQQLQVTLPGVASPGEHALLIRVQQALNTYLAKRRRELASLLLRDLRLLYGVRNGIAHAGHSEMGISQAHYLFNLGLEMLKAAISELISVSKDAQVSEELKLDHIWKGCRKFVVARFATVS